MTTVRVTFAARVEGGDYREIGTVDLPVVIAVSGLGVATLKPNADPLLALLRAIP